MKRTQISLTEKQYQLLKAMAEQSGESVSAIIRRAIERMKKAERQPQGDPAPAG